MAKVKAIENTTVAIHDLAKNRKAVALNYKNKKR